MTARFEILPFESGEREAELAPRPLTLTVTCSPRHGVEHSIATGARLRALGHDVIVHVAARMVTDLDALLEQLRDAGIADVFLVGGDAPEPLGPYASALDLLEPLRAHPLAPRSIGVAAYPEGHPLIDDATLAAALREKNALADFMTTQVCLDPRTLLAWIERTRADGVTLPLYVGIPGPVDPRRLLEISLRIGVGASIRFARKQHGVARLLGRRTHAADRVHAAVRVGEHGIAGIHYFTFNRLLDTLAWAEREREELTA